MVYGIGYVPKTKLSNPLTSSMINSIGDPENTTNDSSCEAGGVRTDEHVAWFANVEKTFDVSNLNSICSVINLNNLILFPFAKMLTCHPFMQHLMVKFVLLMLISLCIMDSLL